MKNNVHTNISSYKNFCKFVALVYCCSQSCQWDAWSYILIMVQDYHWQWHCGMMFHDVIITVTSSLRHQPEQVW